MAHRHTASPETTEIAKLIQAQRLEEARTYCTQQLRMQGSDAILWGLCSVVHGMLDDSREAEHCAREAIRLKPDYAEAHNNLGLALRLQGRAEEAIGPLEEALRLRPDYADALYNLGVVLAVTHRTAAAIESYRSALQLRPDDPEGLNNLGNALSETGRHEEAVNCYRKTLALRPDFLPAQRNLARLLIDFGQRSEALSLCRAALKIYPDDTDMRVNLGVVLEQGGQRDEALATYRQAIATNPDNAEAHFNLSLMLLGQANFYSGWTEYDRQWRREGAPRRPLPPSSWDGSDLDGHAVFLHAEQGLGDELFFLRFVPWLRSCNAGKIIYRPSIKLASLLARLPTLDKLAMPNEHPPESALIFSVGDLPRLLGMKHADQIPPPITLPVLADRLATMQKRLAALGPAPYLGITWRGGTKLKKNVLYKESPLTAVAQALRDIPATVLVLQRQPLDGEVAAFSKALGRPVHDLSALNEDLEQMLALLSLIDEYVGVSNTNMHLRAAVGRTARVLVPAPPEWRWMAAGTESPWFPGFSVYRQGYDGSWGEAFDMLSVDLQLADGR